MVLGAALLLGGYGYSAASNGGLDVYSGGIDMHSNSISNLADPSSAQDAATMSWTDNNALSPDGSESMNGNLNMGDNDINYQDMITSRDAASGNYIKFDGGCGSSCMEIVSDSLDGTFGNISMKSNGPVTFYNNYDQKSGSEYCRLDNFGDWSCTGAKNWVHSLNDTHEAVYTSQESPQVRAVYEGKDEIENKTKIELPSHFSKTVSDTEPKLRATATVQGELAYAAVIEKTDDYIVLDSSEPATVNYRITGIREGYEDKQVVRKKEE